MTLFEKIEFASMSGTNGIDLQLSADEVVRVHAALTWARQIIDTINAEEAETEGGNAALSGLDEDAS